MTELRPLDFDGAADHEVVLRRLRLFRPDAPPRTVLVCRWRIDAVTGRPVCQWVEDPGR
jgi:hypothetical protein